MSEMSKLQVDIAPVVAVMNEVIKICNNSPKPVMRSLAQDFAFGHFADRLTRFEHHLGGKLTVCLPTERLLRIRDAVRAADTYAFAIEINDMREERPC